MNRTVIGVLLLLAVALVGALKCPDNCECTPVRRGGHIHNHVRCMDVEELRVLGKTTDVDSLDLSGLNLTKITNQLDKLSSLSKLDLSGNHLSEINSLRNKYIRSLNLSHNRLTTGKLLSIPEHVKHLDLSYNEITDLPLEFKRLVGLKSLLLHGNPLNCSCDTLEVRNWLQEKLVWTNQPIVCAEPDLFKGKPWLQARQAEVCDHRDDNEPRILPYGNTDASDDENDLMMGDDPTIGDVEATEEPEDDELGKDFIPVTPKAEAQKSDSAADYDYAEDEYVEEGSGGGDELVTRRPVTTPAPEQLPTEEDVYEGSGDEVTELINTVRLIKPDEGSFKQNDTSHEEEDEDDDGSGSVSRVLFTHHSLSNDTDSSEEDLTNATLVDVQQHVHRFNDSADSGTSGNISLDTEAQGETKEGKSTYILLAVLAVILVVLILFVACKRDKKPAKKPVDDCASGARELLPVQKKPQPVTQNGSAEIVPLIAKNGKPNGNADNNVNDLEGPLLQKLNEIEEPPSDVKYENELPQSNVTTAPATPNNESRPESPKPSRYSPVSVIEKVEDCFGLEWRSMR